MASKRRQQFIDEASSDALLRFGPELSVLRSLMSEATSGYRQKVHSAQAGAAGIQAAVAAARPQLEAIYPDAVGGIPGLSRAQALGDLASRGVRASESAAGARRTALQELAADRAKIGARRTDIAQELGAFTTSQVGKLSSAAAQRDLSNRISLRSQRQSERSSVRSSGIDPDTGKPIPGGKLDPKTAAKKKLRTQDAHGALVDSITNAQDTALPLAKQAIKDKGAKAARGYVDYLLRTGVDQPAVQTPVYETTATGTQRKKLNPDGTPVVKTAPPVKIDKVPAAVRGAALDLIFDGHISRKHVRALQRGGFSLAQLGLPTPGRPGRPQVRDPRPQASGPYSRRGPRVA